ncbi:MAG: cell division protein ZipA [Gammaproteobacteria bacterium]
MSLQLLLIVIGAFIVAGVYFFSARRRRRDAPVLFGRRFNRDLPDITLHHDDDFDEQSAQDSAARQATTPAFEAAEDEDDEPAAAPSPRQREPDRAATPAPSHGLGRASGDAAPAAVKRALAGGIVLSPADLDVDDLPRVRNDALIDGEPDNTRRASDQLDLFGAESAAPQPRSRRATRAAPAEPDPATDDGVITLFVRAPERRPFGGPELVRALNAVGMKFGDMSIFHHFGSGDLRCESAVFSAANMFEPGTFDLPKIEAFRTSGVVLFMQLPGPLEGPVAFELLLNTAQRLAELSGGELCVTPQAALDPQAIARLRRRAARFDHAHP